MKVGRVYLVGAGPGDPELVTLRAVRKLREADLVLYDALVHPKLLAHCRPDAELVFVGKRAGKPSERQSRILERLVEGAKAGRVVARLKGGDPYLFGRGSEEAERLSREGIPFEIVPGVPSSMAATAYAGISLTHRDLASSVAYVTATESEEKDESSHDWSKLATATQTLVIFMGLRKLDGLMKILVEHGRSPETPVAVVQSASLPEQHTVVGTVATIAQLAHDAGLVMPALTIVGEVVRLRELLRWYDLKPLFGKRVLVTRPSGQADKLAELLRDQGADPIELPTIAIVDPVDRAPLVEAAANVARYDWVVFTSQNGVDRFFAELRAQRKDARGLRRVCAIGPATSDALRRQGIEPDVMPGEYRGEEAAKGVIAFEGGTLAGKRVLMPRAKVAREVLPEMLRAHGATVDVVPTYETVPPDPASAASLRAMLADGALDIVTFTSSSTVESFLAMAGDAPLDGLLLASIGPITTATAESRGLEVAVTAATYDNAGLVSALVAHYEG